MRFFYTNSNRLEGIFVYLLVLENRLSLFYFEKAVEYDENKVIREENVLSLLSELKMDHFPFDMKEWIVPGEFLGAQNNAMYKMIDASSFAFEDNFGRGENTGRDSWIIFGTRYNLLHPVNVGVTQSTTKPFGSRKYDCFPDCFPALEIFIPLPNRPLLSKYNILTLRIDPEQGFGTNIDKAVFEHVSVYKRASPFVEFEIEGPDTVQRDVSQTYIVKATLRGEPVKEDFSMYLDCSAGYLPNKRIDIVQGLGEFRFIPLYLSVGERAQLKLSWKYYTGEAEKLVEVVE